MTTIIVTPVTSAPDRLLAAENAAWDAYEAALADVKEAQNTLVAAGSSVLQAYRATQRRREAACNALGDALAVANAEYGDHKKD